MSEFPKFEPLNDAERAVFGKASYLEKAADYFFQRLIKSEQLRYTVNSPVGKWLVTLRENSELLEYFSFKVENDQLTISWNKPRTQGAEQAVSLLQKLLVDAKTNVK